MNIRNYETEYFIKSITSTQGRRYNILPAAGGVEPLISRNISKDDVTGFFRAMILDDHHLKILKLVNQYMILEFSSIKTFLGYTFNELKKRLTECILTGLIYENHIKLLEKEEYFWYMMDTGGVYALDDMNMKTDYNHMPFTTGLDMKYKHYVKSQFLIDNYGYYTFQSMNQVVDRKGKSYRLMHLEDVEMSQLSEYNNTIFIVNLEVLDQLKMNEWIHKNVVQTLCEKNNIFYDIAGKSYLEIKI